MKVVETIVSIADSFRIFHIILGRRGKPQYGRLAWFFLFFIMIHNAWAGYDDPFYDYRGQNTFRETHPYQPEERFDPFTGNFSIIYTDVYLPSNAGLDIKIQRVYNSDIYRKDGAQDMPVPDSWVGLGWSLHMGRLVCPLSENKYLEMPDDSKHIFYQDINNPAQWISKEYWLLQYVNPDKYQILFTNGTKWTFDMNIYGSIPEPGTTHIFFPTIQISDPFGNTVTINYEMVSPETFISSISDNLNRTITFNYSTTGTKNLNSINVNGNYVYYFYTDINLDYSMLTGVRYPSDPTGYYSYSYEYSTVYPEHELVKVYNPWGGYIMYVYGYNNFSVGGIDYSFRVLTQRTNNASGSWAFNYGLAADNCDSVTITDPYGTKTMYMFWGYRYQPTSGNNWKLGLMTRKRVNGNGAVCRWQFTYGASTAISNDDYWGPISVDNQIFVGRVTKREITIDNKTYTTDYTDFDNYSQPRTISETGDASRTITRTYWYNTSLNIVDHIATENSSYNSTAYNTSYTYNTNGSLASKNTADVITNYTYYSDGNLKRITDETDRWVEYSNYEKAVAKTIAKGRSGNTTYSVIRTVNWASTIATETNGRGYSTSFQYDGRNRLTRITPPNATPTPDPTIIEYQNTGDYKKVSIGTSSGASWTKYYYDDWGQIDRSENSVGVLVDYSHDHLSRRTFESFPYTTTRLGDTITYDGLDRVKRITHPDNNYTENTYYQSKITFRNERSKNTEYQYIAFSTPFTENFLGSIKDALNQITTYNYNAAGYLLSLNAAGSYGRTYHYNSNYFMDYETSPERGQTNYTYDNAGNLYQRTDANGNTTAYTYDNVTRLINIDYPAASYDVNFYFDKADNCTLMTVPSNSCSLFYDALNRVTKKKLLIDGLVYSVIYAHDTKSNISRITYSDGNYVDYTYDTENRVLTIPGYINSNITYHPSGKELSYISVNGRTTSFTYNNRYWVSTIAVSGSTMNESYQYDAVGSLTTLTDNLNGGNNQSYTYDDIDRLKTFNGPWGNGTYNYTSGYAVGRRYQEIVGPNTNTYNYDATTHRLASITGANPALFNYDNNGNVIEVPGVYSFTYDYENRPTYMYFSPNENRTTFVYDGNGVRVRKDVKHLELLETPYVPYAYYVNGCHNDLLYEEQNRGSEKNRYIYLNGKRVAKINHAGEKFFFHNDYLGSAKAMTNDVGTRVYTWLGYPFGLEYSSTGGSNNYYRFTDKEYDQSTQLYYFGARYYCPLVGKFITPDPGVGPSGLNKKRPITMSFYGYCADNPTRYVDPDGRDVFVAKGMKSYVHDAYRRSETFRALYDGLRRNREVVVWIRSEDAVKGDNKPYRGHTAFLGKENNIRRIDCYVVSTEDRSAQGYLAGHELVHATEIAENENINTFEDYENWQQEMLKAKKARLTNGKYWCTYAASDKQTQIYQEILNDVKGEDDIIIENKEIDKPYLNE